MSNIKMKLILISMDWTYCFKTLDKLPSSKFRTIIAKL